MKYIISRLFCPSYIIYQVHTAVLANQIKCKKLVKDIYHKQSYRQIYQTEN